MRVLVACEFSGRVRDAFARRGHYAISCDYLPSETPGCHHFGDVLEYLKDPIHRFDLMIAHPPCTYLTCTGNKWFKPEYALRFPDRVKQREKAIEFFMALACTNIPRIAIENPIGIMSTHYRKPDQIIQPYQFGIPISKATCLWLKGLPPLRPTQIVAPELDKFASGNVQSKWHTQTGRIRDRNERMKARSRTFPEIAEAMAEQWGGLE